MRGGGGNLNNWGGARTGCNNYFCVFFFVRELLIESYINSEIFTGFDAKMIIATGARATPIIEISPPHKNPPLETPDIRN